MREVAIFKKNNCFRWDTEQKPVFALRTCLGDRQAVIC